MKDKKIYLVNAFSLQMLNDFNTTIHISELEESYFNEMKSNLLSAIGHQDTANVLGVEMNRVNISLDKGDFIIVAQLVGGRLPEGSTTLPVGFSFKYLLVRIL